MAKTKAVVKVSKKEVVSVDTLVQEIKVLHIELHSSLQKAKIHADLAVGYAVAMGEKLVEVKGLIARGDWESWASENLPINLRTAQRYMRAYTNPGASVKPRKSIVKEDPEIGSLSFFLPTVITETVEVDPAYDVSDLTTDEIVKVFKKRVDGYKKQLKTAERLKQDMRDQLTEAITSAENMDPKNLEPKIKKLLKRQEDVEANIRGLEQVYARINSVREILTKELAMFPALSIRSEVVPIISPDMLATADLLDNLSVAIRGKLNV